MEITDKFSLTYMIIVDCCRSRGMVQVLTREGEKDGKADNETERERKK